MSRCDFEKEPVDTHNVIYGAEHGRVVEVLDTSHRILVVDPRGQINAVGCTWDVRLSDHEIPTPLLHTCQESRQQALKIYEVSFKGLESSLPGSSVAKYIYFDWNRDELMVDDARAWESFCGKDTPVPNDEPQAVPLWFSKIQHLKVSCGFKNCIKLCEDRLTELAALKTLSILGHRCPAHRGTQRPCSSVARREAKFTERLESKWEQELGQESKKSLPKIAFISWSDFFAENISRNKVCLTIIRFTLEFSD
jgi:hypothetical protein